MPDRYGEPDDDPIVDLDAPVADFDSRRRARESAAARQRAEEQRGRLAESRAVHAPMTRAQSEDARAHRIAVTEQVERRRSRLRIADCDLCDDDGYTPGLVICDHRDHRPAAARGMAHLRDVMGWDSTDERSTTGVGASGHAAPRTTPATSLSPTEAGQSVYGARSGDSTRSESHPGSDNAPVAVPRTGHRP